MTDPYDVYNAVIDIMCTHCNKTIRDKCKARDENKRCKTKIICMHRILKRDDEEYPIKLPKVKRMHDKKLKTQKPTKEDEEFTTDVFGRRWKR